MSTPIVPPNSFANQRRSQRILLAMRIVVSGTRKNAVAFIEPTSTLIVNAHGAMIHLREFVEQGQLLTVRNVTTQEDVVCKVVDINLGPHGTPEVGVEFSEPNPHFWRVTFPPADWTSRSPEAKRFSSTPAAPLRPASIPVVKK